MFIKVEDVPKDKTKVTDVINRDKKGIRYRAIYQILKTIHFLFFPKQQESVVEEQN